VNERRVLDGVEDGIVRILHGQHEAGGKLLQVAAGVHERGRVGQKFQRSHHAVKLVRERGHIRGRMVEPLDLRDVYGHTLEHAFRGFDHKAVGIAFQVAFFQDSQGVGGQAGGYRHTILHEKIAG